DGRGVHLDVDLCPDLGEQHGVGERGVGALQVRGGDGAAERLRSAVGLGDPLNARAHLVGDVPGGGVGVGSGGQCGFSSQKKDTPRAMFTLIERTSRPFPGDSSMMKSGDAVRSWVATSKLLKKGLPRSPACTTFLR